MKIWLIGQQYATLASFVSALQSAGVAQIADVRANRDAGDAEFAVGSLVPLLREAGIDYFAFDALANPPAGLKAARTGYYDEMADIYLAYLDSDEPRRQIEQLSSLAAERPTALLGFDRFAVACHRKVLAEAAFPKAEHIRLLP